MVERPINANARTAGPQGSFLRPGGTSLCSQAPFASFRWRFDCATIEKQNSSAGDFGEGARGVSDYILETQGLTKDFLGFTAVKGVDLKVRRGSVRALIGPNGAGKTTVFNLLTKFLRPTKGTITFKGEDVT